MGDPHMINLELLCKEEWEKLTNQEVDSYSKILAAVLSKICYKVKVI